MSTMTSNHRPEFPAEWLTTQVGTVAKPALTDAAKKPLKVGH